MPEATLKLPPRVPKSVIAMLAGIGPLPPARVRSGILAPVRATLTRGDGPATATAAANVPSTISPTPTNASRRLASIDFLPQREKSTEGTGDPVNKRIVLPETLQNPSSTTTAAEESGTSRRA